MLYGVGRKGALLMKNPAFLALFSAVLSAAASSAAAQSQSLEPPDQKAIVEDQAVADILDRKSVV